MINPDYNMTTHLIAHKTHISATNACFYQPPFRWVAFPPHRWRYYANLSRAQRTCQRTAAQIGYFTLNKQLYLAPRQFTSACDLQYTQVLRKSIAYNNIFSVSQSLYTASVSQLCRFSLMTVDLCAAAGRGQDCSGVSPQWQSKLTRLCHLAVRLIEPRLIVCNWAATQIRIRIRHDNTMHWRDALLVAKFKKFSMRFEMEQMMAALRQTIADCQYRQSWSLHERDVSVSPLKMNLIYFRPPMFSLSNSAVSQLSLSAASCSDSFDRNRGNCAFASIYFAVLSPNAGRWKEIHFQFFPIFSKT